MELEAPDNGTVNVTGQFIGDNATYACNSGFEFLDPTTGRDMRTCQLDGVWTGCEQRCVRKL